MSFGFCWNLGFLGLGGRGSLLRWHATWLHHVTAWRQFEVFVARHLGGIMNSVGSDAWFCMTVPLHGFQFQNLFECFRKVLQWFIHGVFFAKGSLLLKSNFC
ncbi:hypothetical protein M758_11G155700 [Ceratodon purpureus]|nr:hypothetical protein M758_11G155700 [Ceratodon purpureus]